MNILVVLSSKNIYIQMSTLMLLKEKCKLYTTDELDDESSDDSSTYDDQPLYYSHWSNHYFSSTSDDDSGSNDNLVYHYDYDSDSTNDNKFESSCNPVYLGCSHCEDCTKIRSIKYKEKEQDIKKSMNMINSFYKIMIDKYRKYDVYECEENVYIDYINNFVIPSFDILNRKINSIKKKYRKYNFINQTFDKVKDYSITFNLDKIENNSKEKRDSRYIFRLRYRWYSSEYTCATNIIKIIVNDPCNLNNIVISKINHKYRLDLQTKTINEYINMCNTNLSLKLNDKLVICLYDSITNFIDCKVKNNDIEKVRLNMNHSIKWFEYRMSKLYKQNDIEYMYLNEYANIIYINFIHDSLAVIFHDNADYESCIIKGNSCNCWYTLEIRNKNFYKIEVDYDLYSDPGPSMIHFKSWKYDNKLIGHDLSLNSDYVENYTVFTNKNDSPSCSFVRNIKNKY